MGRQFCGKDLSEEPLGISIVFPLQNHSGIESGSERKELNDLQI